MGIHGKVRVCAIGSEPSPVLSLQRPRGELQEWSLPARVTEGGGEVGLISEVYRAPPGDTLDRYQVAFVEERIPPV